jgi:uncharacterized protein
MSTAEPKASGAPVPSPCISVCEMNASRDVCKGCFRTLDEIAAWSRLSDSHKRAIWAELPTRRALQQQR